MLSKNQELVWDRLYAKAAQTKPRSLKFHVGDLVKMSTKKALFKKSSTQNYTSENFRIAKAVKAYPTNYYYFETIRGEKIVGSVVEAQLIRVNYALRKSTRSES